MAEQVDKSFYSDAVLGKDRKEILRVAVCTGCFG
jgi:hypothetical protein